jgi:CBS domain-containing protein
MLQTVRELMTPDPITLSAYDTVSDAARVMRERDVGSILITDLSDRLCGIVTDRDLVVRAIALGRNPDRTPLQDVYSEAIAELHPDDSVDNAIRLMAKKGVRRVPVVDGTHAVGVLSLGDLAMARDPESALAGISSSPANR